MRESEWPEAERPRRITFVRMVDEYGNSKSRARVHRVQWVIYEGEQAGSLWLRCATRNANNKCFVEVAGPATCKLCKDQPRRILEKLLSELEGIAYGNA